MTATKNIPAGLVTFPEAAKRLDIGLPTAFRLVNAGKFPVPAFGVTRRVRRDDLDAFLSGRLPAAADGPDSLEVSLARLGTLAERSRALVAARPPVLTLISGGAPA